MRSEQPFPLLQDLSGFAAVEAYRNFPTERSELRVNCESYGGQSWQLRLGLFGATAYGFLDTFSGDVSVGEDWGCRLKTCAREDAGKLFGELVQWIKGREGMVNSDPHSPDFFTVDTPDLAEAIRTCLHVTVAE